MGRIPSCDSLRPPGIYCLLRYLFAGLLLPWAVAFNLDVMGALRKEGEPGSLFGFSVALHRQLQPRPQSWLLVGAPQALALPGQQANRTGGLFACPLSLEETDCYRVDIDRGANVQKESKENQWLGVSVRSQGPGGKIVTCAHRYESRQRVDQILETRDVIGRCFVLSEDLAIRDELDGGEWKFCEGRPQGHEQFGFCQQGTAATFSPDSHYLVFGAPGTYNWKGFSIDSAKGLLRAEELSFVAGAPRANHKGAVVILRKDSASRLIPEVVLSGERLTSGFGYSLAVADLNNDRWPDLIVGAPYFFERQEELGGAVYVYMNQGGRWTHTPPLRICGSPDSMFGISLAVLGDLNQDGFPDIAVGAPFDGDGKVFIYHGSSLGMVVKPSQVLEGEAVSIKSFGYSLSGGLDVDGNYYPDLLVGSLADTAALFRARPVLHVSQEIFIAPRAIDLEQPNCAGGRLVCVDIRICFSYTAVPSSYSPVVALDYTLDGDTDRRLRGQVPRVTFLSRGLDDLKHQSSGTVWLKHQQDRVCGDAMFQLQIHFLKQGCGEDKICQSNLQLVQARFCSRISDTEFQPLPMISEQELHPVSVRAQVFIELPLSISGVATPQQLFFSGVVKGESAMRSERDVGSKVKYEITVSNQGQSLNTLGSAFLNIMWPHEIANGKWLLYPMRVELEGGQGPGKKGICSPRPNILRLDVDSRDRRPRELEQPEPQEPPEKLEPSSTSWWPVSSAERKRNVTLDCAQGTAKCVVFSCPLYSFDRVAVLHVWGRLWNSTFLEEYIAVKSLEVIVRANITVKSSIKNLLLRDASTTIPVMVYLDPMAVVAEGVPWWVILLAVLAGLLVLALLVLLLWKLGFFKRAKHPEATVPQYHAVKILREDRQQFKEEKTGTIQRSNWGNSQWEGSDAHPILDADWHPDLGPDGTPVPVTA
ncbi:Integrin alpha-7 [Cricetulus griseus]|uniref:Integrin alpha-7 n=1 Tax=Cricetulus griseus TaxID=10029 RepID=G3HRM0_CRIGR|nr:Integrin alpha-7 [Cricetulus griseus]